jgi:uncharacterized protein YndB with AHSA1/START domain
MTDVTERQSIRVGYELTAPPEKVWRALVEPSLLERRLMPNDIFPPVGHRFTFRTQPAPEFDGIVHCEVIDEEPTVRIVYTWKGGTLQTVVTWRLEPTPTGTTWLSLVHEGFKPEDRFTYELLEDGWRKKVAGSLEQLTSSL